MKSYNLTSFLIFICSVIASGQSTIDEVILQISQNNKSLQSQSKIWEAKKLEHKLGTTLYDPTLSFDYMRGSPQAIAGNQTDINLVQRFDFPTVYGKKKALSNEMNKQSEYVINIQKQTIKLASKKICIELIYRQKLNDLLQQRKLDLLQHEKNYQKKLDKGEGNILDVNKIKIQLIELTKELQQNEINIKFLQQELVPLNGGIPIMFNEKEYPLYVTLATFEQIEKEIEDKDPERKYLEQEHNILQKEVDINKALALPKFDVGYHYQGVLGQNFYGGKIGLSLPLWENKYLVKYKQAEVEASQYLIEQHKSDHYQEIKQMYNEYLLINASKQSYKSLIDELDNLEILDKALSLGELTLMEYFIETNYIYEAKKSYLKMEWEAQDKLTELLGYKL